MNYIGVARQPWAGFFSLTPKVLTRGHFSLHFSAYYNLMTIARLGTRPGSLGPAVIDETMALHAETALLRHYYRIVSTSLHHETSPPHEASITTS